MNKTETQWLDIIEDMSEAIPQEVTLSGAIHHLSTLLATKPFDEETQGSLVAMGALMYRHMLAEMNSGLGLASLMERAQRK